MATPVNHLLCSSPACLSIEPSEDRETEVRSDVPFGMVISQLEDAAARAGNEPVERGFGHGSSGIEHSTFSDLRPSGRADGRENRSAFSRDSAEPVQASATARDTDGSTQAGESVEESTEDSIAAESGSGSAGDGTEADGANDVSGPNDQRDSLIEQSESLNPDSDDRPSVKLANEDPNALDSEASSAGDWESDANPEEQQAGQGEFSEEANAAADETRQADRSDARISNQQFETDSHRHQANNLVNHSSEATDLALSSDRFEAVGTLPQNVQFEQTQAQKESHAATLSLEELLKEAPMKESIGKTGAVIKEAIQSSLKLNGKTVQLELHPAELGTLKIQVTQVDHNIETRILATEHATSELLLSHRDLLMETLAELGFKSSDVDISHEDQAFESSEKEGESKDSPQQSKTKKSPVDRLETQTPGGLNLIV